jgi:alkaline phosphatase D
MSQEISRRKFLATTAVTVAGAGAVLGRLDPAVGAETTLTRVDDVPTGVMRTWLAPQYWSNRLQDWRLAEGRIESLTAVHGGQTVGVLTRRVTEGNLSGAISVRTGTLATEQGFCGFLVGAGAGALDWRAAAIVMAPSGHGGGLLATYDGDGSVRFRDHSSESDQFGYAELAVTARAGPAPARTLTEDVVLLLEIIPTGSGLVDLQLSARRFDDGTLLSQATRSAVSDASLVGGISLISTARSGGRTARHWFRELKRSSRRDSRRPTRIRKRPLPGFGLPTHCGTRTTRCTRSRSSKPSNASSSRNGCSNRRWILRRPGKNRHRVARADRTGK